jgi:hypothetical protein
MLGKQVTLFLLNQRIAKKPSPIERERGMRTINQITIEELENLIEQKIMEILGDPDTNLELREDFKEELKVRLASRLKRVSHQEVMKRFG